MTMSRDELSALVAGRIERAQTTLAEAEGVAKAAYWNLVANRLYYAAFYMVSALLVRHGYECYTHMGARGLFSLHFVKTGIVGRECLRLFTTLTDLRQKGDYDDFVEWSEADVVPLIEPTRTFIAELERLCVANESR
jgi:uncharacterized protein (UPF0332 family)